MKRVIVLAVAVGLLATACGGGKSGGGSNGFSSDVSSRPLLCTMFGETAPDRRWE